MKRAVTLWMGTVWGGRELRDDENKNLRRDVSELRSGSVQKAVSLTNGRYQLLIRYVTLGDLFPPHPSFPISGLQLYHKRHLEN